MLLRAEFSLAQRALTLPFRTLRVMSNKIQQGNAIFKKIQGSTSN